MKVDVWLPKIGFSMESGTISEWLVSDGGQAAEGKPLYMMEIDKAVEEVEAPASGLLSIKAAAGETYPVGTLLATIETSG
ncbi:MAG: biotin/lipoyl attachment protein [Gammaproteobacteria bacterium]|nr:biotin/lipoyl attachment protein [Gammaproteobacteria bacterium]